MFGLCKIRFTIGRINYAYLRQIHIPAYKSKRVHPKANSATEELLKKYQNDIVYSDYIEIHNVRIGYKLRQLTENVLRHEENKALQRIARIEPLPFSLKYISEDFNSKMEPQEIQEPVYPIKTQFPYGENKVERVNETQLAQALNTDDNDLDLEVKTRLELYNKSSDHLNWMQDYENYKFEPESTTDDWKVNYGTPMPNSKISDVPCGGCGALLHCKDTAIPGYLPSEIFMNYTGRELKEIVCQRCYFLKNYDLALQVRVGADDYPKVINTIATKQNALVLLIVDLLDLPCSIWPGIADLIGYNRPIVVVGNKIDLLPHGGKGYLNHIEANLTDTMKLGGFGMCNIKHVALISAKTGFGVEELITKLHYLWQYKGDVFLVGCTNVGKSTLFNALLQSDYCKSQAVDLIQRATTSPWPGTTLNLLKFPILRPSGRRLEIRMRRMRSMRKLEHQERKLRSIQSKALNDSTLATLVGHIDRTFILNDIPEGTKELDNYRRNKRIGINEKDKDYALSKWCYDTPGVVQPDQLIHRLTTEELVLTFPKELIKARTFTLQPGASIFIGGLARLDFIEGTDSVRFTVFCSNNLPITICKLSIADEFYKAFLPTDLFAVPLSYPERLKFWPGLRCSKLGTFTGIDREVSCTDVVLSSAGWIAVTPVRGDVCTLQGWTPEARGVYFRNCLLPTVVANRGRRRRKSCIYSNDKFKIV